MYLTAALLALDVARTLPVMKAINPYADLFEVYRSEVKRSRPCEGVKQKAPTESDGGTDPSQHPDFDVPEWHGFHIDGDRRYQER